MATISCTETSDVVAPQIQVSNASDAMIKIVTAEPYDFGGFRMRGKPVFQRIVRPREVRTFEVKTSNRFASLEEETLEFEPEMFQPIVYDLKSSKTQENIGRMQLFKELKDDDLFFDIKDPFKAVVGSGNMYHDYQNSTYTDGEDDDDEDYKCFGCDRPECDECQDIYWQRTQSLNVFLTAGNLTPEQPMDIDSPQPMDEQEIAAMLADADINKDTGLDTVDTVKDQGTQTDEDYTCDCCTYSADHWEYDPLEWDYSYDYPIYAEAGIEQQDTLIQQENTVFTDQRETTTDDGYITTQTLSNLQNMSMPENEWHVRNIMNKPIPFWSGDWTTTQTIGTEVKSWKVPGQTLFGPHYNLVSTFTFFRGHPKIRFQVNGTKFHQGRLIAYFVPMYDFGSYEDSLYTVDNATAFPHVILDASMANSGELTLPFVHQNTYFNSYQSRPWQYLGQLFLKVFNQLGAADSSSKSIGVTAWVSYENCELHQPCAAHTVKFPPWKKPAVLAESGIEGLMKAAVPMVKDLVAPELSAMTGLVQGVGNVMGGTSNMDKPTDPMEIQRWVPNAVTGLAHGEGIDRGMRLCLKPGTYTVGDADLICTTKDDMNLLELCKIPTRIFTTPWTDAMDTGKSIFYHAIGPCVTTDIKSDDTTDPPVDVISTPLISYIARGFKYWRGSLRMKIQVIASQMHTGRLMVSYGAGVPFGLGFAEGSYLNTYVIDLQEKHEVEFEVPYLAERPWLRCDKICPDSVITDEITENQIILGWIKVYVLNRLSRPSNVASSVDINVLMSAGDDFELAFPTDFATCQGIGSVIPKPKAESLVTEDTVSTRTDTGNVSLTAGSGHVQSAAVKTMSENAMDLKTLLRRYNKVYSNSQIHIADGANYISFLNTPTLSSKNTCFDVHGKQNRTTLAHFSELFTFWRGSLRYKLVITISGTGAMYNNAALSFNVIHFPGVFNRGNFSPQNMPDEAVALTSSFENYGVMVGTTKTQSSIEFEVPFYTPYTQLKTVRSSVGTALDSTGLVFVGFDTGAIESTKDTQVLLELYQAAGDDFSLNYLRTAPKIQFVKGAEAGRDLTDDALFLWTTLPNPCAKKTTKKEETDMENIVPVAEALSDYIPGYSGYKQVLQTTQAFQTTAVKVDSVCDTANHILQQASKKLGLIDDEEEDEEKPLKVQFDCSSMTAPLVPILDGLLAFVKTLPDSISPYFRPSLTTMDILTDVSNLVSGFTAFGAASCFIQKVCAVVTIVSTLIKDLTIGLRNVLYHFASDVLTQMNGSKQGNGLPKAEAANFDLVAPLTATLAVAVGAIGFKKIPTDKETMDMCRNISEKLKLFNFSSSALANVKGLWTEIKELMQWCMDYVMNLVAPHLLAQLKLERGFTDIEAWAAFVDELENSDYADRIHYDYEFKNSVFRAIDQGKEYNKLLITGKCGRAANVIREYVRKALEIGERCKNSKNELPFRKDPYCVAIFGPTNTGKSGSVTSLAFQMLNNLNFPRHNRWCAVNCTDKYFSENYRQQSAVYFDDFSTFDDEEQYKKFFNLKANSAFPLDMAFRKGEYFNSDFIFMTTNTAYPNPNFLTNRMAFLRRRDMLIEADWIDSPEIRQALENKENMRRFRQLDHSHLRFRVRNSSDSRMPPGPWMTFDEMVTRLTEDAHEHLDVQQRKLTNDLIGAGYIVPDAEGGEERKLCIEACKNSPALSIFTPDLWEHLTYDPATETFDLFQDTDGKWNAIEQDWNDCQDFFKLTKVDLQETLRRHSFIVKGQEPLISKVRTGLKEFKALMTSTMEKIKTEYPFVYAIGKWGIYLSAAIAALWLAWTGTQKVLHACLCKTLNHYGFRCGLCGRWPKMGNVRLENQKFITDQWVSLYGALPYEDGRVTTLQEESALLSVSRQSKVELVEMELGTQKKAEAIYSDITRGLGPTRIMAQMGPYSSTQVKGGPSVKITANSSENSGKPSKAITRVAESQSIDDLITNRVFPYLYRMRTCGKVGFSTMSVNGYAIGQRNILVNSHFFHHLVDGDLFEIYHNGAWLKCEFDQSVATNLENKDLVIYSLPVQFHAHKDNTHHFIKESELAYFQQGVGSLCKLDQSLSPVIVENLKISALKVLDFNLEVNEVKVPYHVQNAWKYNKCSAFGDCGSLLIAHSERLTGKIIGIHSASDPNTSYAQLVTREMLEKAVKRHNGTPLPAAESRLGNLIPPGHFGRIGKALKGKEFYQSPKTEILETEIHGMISKPTTFPSVLSGKDERMISRVNPLRNGIEKYSYCAIPFPKRHREIVNEMMTDEVRMMIRKRDPEPLTMEQACNGIPELEGYERLPKNTSPGYPWILTRPSGATGKDYLFENDLPVYDLAKAVEFRDEQARKLERIESVWVDCLKDERRPLDKIQKGSTRVFTIPPVDYSILMRKYTMDFCVAVKDSRAFMECKVGIDPQSLEWSTLYYWLAEWSPYCVAGDFSRFDGSMPADLIDDVRLDIQHYYSLFGKWTQEDANALEILFDELIHTVHLARDEFYMTHIGNKSGNPITVILNSRINKRYMALAWLGLCEKFQKWDYYTMAAFGNNVRMAIYGDDNLLSIKQEVLEWYNQETISEYLAQFNIVYTNEEKTGITKWKRLEECSFLKQTFRDHESVAMIKVPHMKTQTILELLNWTRVAPDQDQLLFDNCNDALRFSYFYGKRFYDQLRDKIIKALNSVGKNWLPKTYMDYHLWFLVTIGALKMTGKAEGFLQDIAHKDSSMWSRAVQSLTVGPVVFAWTMIKGKVADDGRLRNERKAVCIPSGEGKTWLCENYPDLFVDHDSLTLPALEKELNHRTGFEKWLGAGNGMLNPQRFDVDDWKDKRILLTHHPNCTNRTILGEYVLPYPNFNRNNVFNRLILPSPQKLTRNDRNELLISFARNEVYGKV